VIAQSTGVPLAPVDEALVAKAAAMYDPAVIRRYGLLEWPAHTIRRGDTLWAIAKRYLGSGLRYTSIFQSNREVNNDPDLILPQQQVKVPPVQD